MALQPQTNICFMCKSVLPDIDLLNLHINEHFDNPEQSPLQIQFEEYDAQLSDQDNVNLTPLEIQFTEYNEDQTVDVDLSTELEVDGNNKNNNDTELERTKTPNKPSQFRNAGAIIIFANNISDSRKKQTITQLLRDNCQILQTMEAITIEDIRTQTNDQIDMGTLDPQTTCSLLLIGHNNGPITYERLTALREEYTRSQYCDSIYITLDYEAYCVRLGQLFSREYNFKFWAKLGAECEDYVATMSMENQRELDRFHSKIEIAIRREQLDANKPCCCLMSYRRALDRYGLLKMDDGTLITSGDANPAVFDVLMDTMNALHPKEEEAKGMKGEIVKQCEKCIL